MRRFLTFMFVLVTILAVFPLYTRLKVVAAPVPPGVYLGGLDLSNLKDPNEIRAHLDGIYRTPITVYFGEERLALRPQDVDFQVDAEQMVAEAGQYLAGPEFMDIAVRYAFGFPQKRRDIPVRFMLDTDKLNTWLEAVAVEQNHGPQPPRVLPPTARWADGDPADPGPPPGYVGAYVRDWTWIPGAPGQTLDVAASVPIVIDALTHDQARVAHLAIQETSAPAPTPADLAREVNAYLANFPGFAAMFVHDLRTDEEGAVDADVSFSGMSTLKIGIVAAIMQKLPHGIAAGDEEAEHAGQLIDFALGESNNYAANQLLTYLGDGDLNAGTRRFTDFMQSLGFENTYMQSGYDADIQLAEIPTPGNQRTDWDTNPDHNLQTTPAEMGRILSAIYHCAQGSGLLIERYPGEITPDECASILYYMSHDEFQELIWGGLPQLHDAWVVHKHGFAFESHSDVALVWGPTGPYVLSVFLFRAGWMDWGTSNDAMQAVSRITWNFFEFQKDQLGLKAVEPGVLTPPPGYIAVKDEYIPVASTGY